MLDAKSLLDRLSELGAQVGAQGGSPAPGQAGGGQDLLAQAQRALGGSGLGTGALVGGLTALLLGSKAGRKLGGAAIKAGGLALLGSLAYRAYTDWQAGREAQAPSALPEAPPASSPFAPPSTPEAQDAVSKAIIRGMIAAARADGRMDAEETRKVEQALGHAGLGEAARSFLIEALGRADDIDDIARSAATPELAAEMWLAARITIDPDTPEETAFLQDFAHKLRLSPDLVTHLEATAVGAKEA